MAIDRRRLLSGGLGASIGAGLLLPARSLGVGLDLKGLYATARADRAGRCSAVVLDLASGREVAQVALPARGHGIAVRPGNGPASRAGPECVAFARRPGNFGVVFGRNGEAPRWLPTRDDRHFFGHGLYAPDGRLLLTTENDFERGTGVIGVRDVEAGYRRIGEITSGGIDPHEAVLLSDRRTLVVANGGIRTHPDDPRVEIDLPAMQPCLAYVDTETGDLLERHELPGAMNMLSIRHLAVGAGDAVVFGCQWRGTPWHTQPVIGWHRRGKPLQLAALPADITLRLRNYIASVAVNASGEHAIATAPRGGIAVVIEVSTGAQVAAIELADVYGAAPSPGSGFMLSSEAGTIAGAAAAGRPGAAYAATGSMAQPFTLDNHLAFVG